MSGDTTLWTTKTGREFGISGPMKAALIYVFLDVTVSSLTSFGQTLYDLKPEEWAGWWGPKRVAWIMIQLGGILSSALITYKAFFSNKSDQPTNPSLNT